MRPWISMLVPLAFTWAASAETGPITVEQVWSRAAAPGRVGVLYMTITDAGAADRLVAVETPVAERAELHESLSEGGVMKMRPVEAMPVAPDHPLTLMPGGYHVMLLGLRQALREGDSFPVTLRFAGAGPVSAVAHVAKAGAAMPGEHAAMGHDHGAMQH